MVISHYCDTRFGVPLLSRSLRSFPPGHRVRMLVVPDLGSHAAMAMYTTCAMYVTRHNDLKSAIADAIHQHQATRHIRSWCKPSRGRHRRSWRWFLPSPRRHQLRLCRLPRVSHMDDNAGALVQAGWLLLGFRVVKPGPGCWAMSIKCASKSGSRWPTRARGFRHGGVRCEPPTGPYKRFCVHKDVAFLALDFLACVVANRINAGSPFPRSWRSGRQSPPPWGWPLC